MATPQHVSRALTPLLCDPHPGRYRFLLSQDFTVHLAKGLRGEHHFSHGGTIRAVLRNDRLTILSGYAWDGCSPALQIGSRWIGTPTPTATRAASLVHDCLYQFMALPCASWGKRTADEVFYDLMRQDGFRLSGVYHGAVAFFGGLYRRLAKPDSRCLCTEHAPTSH